jgi:hypothetical protein
MRRSHQPDSRAGARPWATRFAALLAVFLQAFILQTHVHAFAPVTAAGYERAADDVSAPVVETASHQELQASCALCQAQSGSRALAPTAQAIAVEQAGALVQQAPEIRRVALAASHSWQSRAPPAHL